MIAFVIVLSILLASASSSTNSVSVPILLANTSQPSSEVWSDDFENVTKSLSEWTFTGPVYGNPANYTPNVTLSNGLLYSDGPGMNVITHNSTTAIGTWSFDIIIGYSMDYWTLILFSMTDWDEHWGTGYAVEVRSHVGEPYWGLDYINLDTNELDIIDSALFDSANSWIHFDITRQSDGKISVFLDGTLLMQATDTRATSSEYFRVNAEQYVILDNLTVSDSVDIEVDPPYWTEPLINHTIDYGEDFSHALSADDYSGLDTWWVNDTWKFSVDDEGVVTNTVRLQVGDYGVEVYVNDTFGNVLSGAFNVEVLPLPIDTTTLPSTSTGPNPLNPLVITLYGAAGVAWFVAVLFIFRDYRNRRDVSAE
jgi:hypothetical protein